MQISFCNVLSSSFPVTTIGLLLAGFFFVFRLMPSQRLSEPFINDTIMLSLFCRQI